MPLPIDERRYEIFKGEIVYMSPSAAPNHSRVILNLATILAPYFSDDSCELFIDGVDVHLSENDVFIPDLMVVCDSDKIQGNGIHGAPDLVIEILSPSTARNDFGYKKDTYEKYGVKEYWLVNPVDWSIHIYVLKNQKFELHDIYTLLPTSTIELMRDEEKKKLITEFSSILFPKVKVQLSEVFKRVLR